ncbi:hypothetical protein RB595_005923 [Gaeumannomyces hyphopodioides]
MKSRLLLSLLGAAAPLLAAPTAVGQQQQQLSPLVRRASDPSQAVPNRFIVLLKPDTSAADVAAHHAHVRRMVLARRDGSSSGGIDRVFHIGSDFSAYVGDFDNATAEEIARLPGVASVEQDAIITVEPTTPPAAVEARAVQTQSDAPWHLGDVSHRDRGAKDYVYDSAAGAGSHVYVLDTGIRGSHAEFGGRVRFGINGLTGSTTAPAPENGDRQGHGTHCASIAAGATYGVAKRVDVADVKVLGDDGAGTLSSVITGINWAVNDIVARKIQKKALLSLSLTSLATDSGPTSIESAVIAAYNQGVTSICAAGNEDGPISNWSPGRIPQCITVGMTNTARSRAAPYPRIFGSNYGPEMDIFAPGDDVRAAGITSDTAVVTKSGTSMATPVVAGVVAYLRSVEGGLDTPEQVRARLIELSLKDVVGDVKGSPNRLLNNNSGL